MAASDVRFSSSAPPGPRSSAGHLKVLAGAIHLTLALLLVQAILAGVFVSDTYENSKGGDNYVTAHGVVADAIWVIGLLAAAYAVVKLRHSHRMVVLLAVAYFVLALIETGIGHLISDNTLLGVSGNRNGLIAVHIPIAIVLFALGAYVASRASRLARA